MNAVGGMRKGCCGEWLQNHEAAVRAISCAAMVFWENGNIARAAGNVAETERFDGLVESLRKSAEVLERDGKGEFEQKATNRLRRETTPGQEETKA